MQVNVSFEAVCLFRTRLLAHCHEFAVLCAPLEDREQVVASLFSDVLLNLCDDVFDCVTGTAGGAEQRVVRLRLSDLAIKRNVARSALRRNLIAHDSAHVTGESDSTHGKWVYQV